MTKTFPFLYFQSGFNKAIVELRDFFILLSINGTGYTSCTVSTISWPFFMASRFSGMSLW